MGRISGRIPILGLVLGAVGEALGEHFQGGTLFCDGPDSRWQLASKQSKSGFFDASLMAPLSF